MARKNLTKLCECGCGKHISKEATRFRLGHNSRVKNPMERHKMAKSCEHEVWRNMKRRCMDSNGKNFDSYGGRGILVCSTWVNSFETFFADMGKRPNGMTLDRRDNEGNYEPSNCRWATPRTQANNRRSNTMITANSETHSIAEWSRVTGINKFVISQRLRVLGWSPEKTMNTPVRKCAKRKLE